LAISGDVIIGQTPFPLRHQSSSFGNPPSPSMMTSYVNDPLNRIKEKLELKESINCGLPDGKALALNLEN
jgi:hypothetical protein